MSQPIVISHYAAEEVNQKIKELKETLEKHNLLMVFNTEIGEGFLFPNTYKVCSVDDNEYSEADPKDLPMSVDGIRTNIGGRFFTTSTTGLQIVQAIILKWIVISYARGSSRLRD